MPKSNKQLSKHSRAARRSVEPDLDLDVPRLTTSSIADGKTRVLEQLAEKGVREQDEQEDSQSKLSGAKPATSGGRVAKSSKNKRTKKKQQRAEMFKDQLAEKVQQAQKRHKTIRGYRKATEEEEE